MVAKIVILLFLFSCLLFCIWGYLRLMGFVGCAAFVVCVYLFGYFVLLFGLFDAGFLWYLTRVCDYLFTFIDLVLTSC